MLRKRCYYTPKNASYFVTRNLGSHFSAKTQNFVPLKILPRLSPDFCLSPKKGWRPARALRVSHTHYTGKMDFFWEGEQDMEALFEHMQRLQRGMCSKSARKRTRLLAMAKMGPGNAATSFGPVASIKHQGVVTLRPPAKTSGATLPMSVSGGISCSKMRRSKMAPTGTLSFATSSQ